MQRGRGESKSFFILNVSLKLQKHRGKTKNQFLYVFKSQNFWLWFSWRTWCLGGYFQDFLRSLQLYVSPFKVLLVHHNM